MSTKKEKTRWVFRAYEDGEYYKWGMHFFERVFYDHTKLKVFSAEHSYKNKDKYPDYVSTYWRIDPEPDKPVSDYDFAECMAHIRRASMYPHNFDIAKRIEELYIMRNYEKY
jgi:hypothetical protein